jgi:DNA-binding LytR/AlgR family response regulator
MKIVIIEDEPLTAKDLEVCIHAAEPGAEVVATLGSVDEAIRYFKEHAAPDIIFSDIQLGDGQSFAIFEANAQIVPVIFCTAYDEYALEAFRAAGIDYILKPFTAKTIAAALAKYHHLKPREEPARRSILVYYKTQIIPVAVEDIALVYVHDESTRLVLFNKQQYVVGKRLEEVEKIVGAAFYRVNRQYLVNREAIKDVSQDAGRRLLVNLLIPFDEPIMVGRVKASAFLSWLAGE